MFRDAFVKLDRKDSGEILEAVIPELGGMRFPPETTTVLSHNVAFYPGYRYLDISATGDASGGRACVLYRPGDVVVLNWTNVPIYELNQRLPIKLDTKNVLDYVRFFFAHVRGRHGRFVVVENADDIPWQEEPPPAARKAVARLIEPVQMTGVQTDGTLDLVVRMLFRDSLFKSRIHVHPDGTIDLSDEELVIEDMPVQDDTLGF